MDGAELERDVTTLTSLIKEKYEILSKDSLTDEDWVSLTRLELVIIHTAMNDSEG